MDLVIKNGTIATESGEYHADIAIEAEIIVDIGNNIEVNPGCRVIDASRKLVLPGGIDAHTHLEASQTNTSDDFEFGTAAAAYGGITTIIDFAKQQPGDTLVAGIERWKKHAEPRAYVDYSAHMMIKSPSDQVLKEIPKIVQLGIPSFKLNMAHRVEGAYMDDGWIFAIMKEVEKLGGLIGLHCENNWMIEYSISAFLREGKKSPKYFAESRPVESEIEAINRALKLAELANANMYVVHISSRKGVELVASAAKRGVSAFAETCPHYLLLTDEVYSKPRGVEFAMTPPLRKEEDKMALWAGLAKGDIKTVGSDHCCFTSAQKSKGEKDFTQIPHGVPGSEIIISLLYSEGVKTGVIPLSRLVQVTAFNPAKLFGLYPKKGAIMVGSDADLVIFDPELRVLLSKDSLHSKVDYSIYGDYTTQGFPVTTISRGEVIVDNRQLVGKKGRGSFLKRETYAKKRSPLTLTV